MYDASDRAAQESVRPGRRHGGLLPGRRRPRQDPGEPAVRARAEHSQHLADSGQRHAEPLAGATTTRPRRRSSTSLTSQPAFRLDYQALVEAADQRQGPVPGRQLKVVPGSIPGFNDTREPGSVHLRMGVDGDLRGSANTTFFEGTYGFSQNQLGAPGVTRVLQQEQHRARRSIPTLYPDSGKFDPSYYEVSILNKYGAPFFVDGVSQLPPTMAWGANIAGPTALPSLGYPSFLNLNRTHERAREPRPRSPDITP